jgi:NADPH:quinone reductase-like Zn-dependent oxidoreductase
MKAVVFEEFGNPATVLRVRDLPLPEPRWGEVRVRMIAAPINPSDLLVVQGKYGRLPTLPATPGFEGVGVVEARGGGLLARRVMGRRVAVLNGKGGNWAEHVVIPARQAVPVSGDLPDDQVASFFVNPASAYVMVTKVLQVPRRAWLLQTAAGSALGRMVIRLGKYYGFKTLNVVRRRESAEELKALGADAVICTDSESLAERVGQITGGDGVRFALDAVGGSLAVEVLRTLGAGGRLLVYGTLADELMTFGSRELIAGARKIEGFWLSEWVKQQGSLKMLFFFRKLAKLIRAGVLKTEIGERFLIDAVAAAVTEAAKPGRKGKVLLTF